MVSLKQRQELADMSGMDPRLKRIQIFLDGEKLLAAGSAGGMREQLLSAIAANDSARFKELADEVGQRKISAESDWCQDDYLLFLLLLGNEKFGRPLLFLGRIIETRRQNPNPIPQKINEVFAALERQEFGIDGEFGFLKIPFLHLVGNLRLGPTEARRALQSMSVPGLLDQMPPFLKLLTQKAHDLVLVERQPLATETTTQLIEGFDAHAKHLSLHDWWHVLLALPGRIILALVFGIVSLGLIPVLFGIGRGMIDSHKITEVRLRPSAIPVIRIHEPDADLPPEALMLAKTLSFSAGPPGKRVIQIVVESAPFSSPTPAFVVEASHPEKPIRNAFAFTESAQDGLRPFTIVPVQRDAGRFRAILPEQPSGQRLCFVLEFEVGTNETTQSVGKRVVLRSLQ
jgi:hypothetical protein